MKGMENHKQIHQNSANHLEKTLETCKTENHSGVIEESVGGYDINQIDSEERKLYPFMAGRPHHIPLDHQKE
jgi:hypothetical protein